MFKYFGYQITLYFVLSSLGQNFDIISLLSFPIPSYFLSLEISSFRLALSEISSRAGICISTYQNLPTLLQPCCCVFDISVHWAAHQHCQLLLQAVLYYQPLALLCTSASLSSSLLQTLFWRVAFETFQYSLAAVSCCSDVFSAPCWYISF